MAIESSIVIESSRSGEILTAESHVAPSVQDEMGLVVMLSLKVPISTSERPPTNI